MNGWISGAWAWTHPARSPSAALALRIACSRLNPTVGVGATKAAGLV